MIQAKQDTSLHRKDDNASVHCMQPLFPPWRPHHFLGLRVTERSKNTHTHDTTNCWSFSRTCATLYEHGMRKRKRQVNFPKQLNTVAFHNWFVSSHASMHQGIRCVIPPWFVTMQLSPCRVESHYTLFSWSRLVVGSSRARSPQVTENVSAKASRMTTLA